MTQKLSSTLLRSCIHSSGDMPKPVAILQPVVDIRNSGWWCIKHCSRFHDNESEFLHLFHPCLIVLLEPRDGRPLVLSPDWLRLVGVLNGSVEVNPFMVIRLSVGNVLLEPSIP